MSTQTCSNPILDFRLAYLRAIAEAWKDPCFRAQWIAAKNAFLLLQRFGFDSPWAKLKLQMVELPACKSKWEPVEVGGWAIPADKFIIKLPAAPQEADRAEALANYYQLFPTLLGPSDSVLRAYEKKSPPDCQEAENDNDFAIEIEGTTAVGGAPGLGANPDTFLAVGALLLRAIALSWTNDLFLSELQKQGIPTLEQYFRFNNPWNFNMEFKLEESFKWMPDEAKWSNIGTNIIELNFPNAPAPALAPFEAIALTSYNNTGPQYPFSCC